MSVEPRKIFYTIGDLVLETGIQQRHINILLEHHGDEIPSLMDGDRRRYTSETVPVLSRLWREYKKGLKEGEAENAWYEKALDKLRDSSDKLSEVTKALRALQAVWERGRGEGPYPRGWRQARVRLDSLPS